MHIAIIDDGVNPEFYRTGKLVHDIEITPSLEIIERKGYNPYMCSHGTTCAAIIKKYCTDAEFSSIKILENDSGNCMQKQLLQAIEWCVNNGIVLVNLSLGSTDYRDFEGIRRSINKAVLMGLIPVAACSNKNIVTYPASLTNVIGVKCYYSNILNEPGIIYNDLPPDGIDVRASGEHLLADYTGNNDLTIPSNSFAAPFVTGLVGNILKEHPELNIEQIKNRICEISDNKDELRLSSGFCRKIDWVDKAAIFYLGNNKLKKVRFDDWIFQVDEIIEVASDNLYDGIRAIKDWVSATGASSKVDTVVLDADVSNYNIYSGDLSDLTETLKRFNKNLVFVYGQAFGHLMEFPEKIPSGIKVWYPDLQINSQISQEEIKIEIDIPIIGVFNRCENSHSGILSRLRTMFRNDGYNAVSASDSYEDILEGGEHFLFGEQDNINNCLKILCKAYSPDLITLGINCCNQDRLKHKNIYRDIPFDVRIFIIKDKNEITDVECGCEAEDIILTFGMDISLNKGAKVFNISEKGFMEKLYTHLANVLNECNFEDGIKLHQDT